MKTKTITMCVACRNANGESDLFVCEVEVTEKEYALGHHYDIAEQVAEDNDYEAPFLAFDETEQRNIMRVLPTLPVFNNGSAPH